MLALERADEIFTRVPCGNKSFSRNSMRGSSCRLQKLDELLFRFLGTAGSLFFVVLFGSRLPECVPNSGMAAVLILTVHWVESGDRHYCLDRTRKRFFVVGRVIFGKHLCLY